MRLQNHSAQPRQYHLYGDGPYHLGIELEVEARDRDTQEKGLELEGPKCRIALAKTDGSLGTSEGWRYGWELVTHPFGRDAWLRPDTCKELGRIRTIVEKLKDLGYRSHDGGRCGLHIHISANAFRGGIHARQTGGTWYPSSYYPGRYRSSQQSKLRRPTHVYWFWKLLQGSIFKKISQRQGGRPITPFYYCAQVTHPTYNRCSVQNDRYSAVNFPEHGKTVEVRIFRGNLRWDRIQKAVQAVIAAVEMTRELTSKNWKQSLDGLFLAYVGRNRDRYPELYSYLRQVGYYNVKAPQTSMVESEVC